MPPRNDFFLNDARIEPRRLTIHSGHAVRAVEPLAMRILLVLAEAEGRVVTREELIQAVWPDGYAGEGSLSRAIWSLRQALEDDARTPRFIETVPRVGYRLKADMRRPQEMIHQHGTEHLAALQRANRRLRRAVIVLAVALAMVGTGWSIHAAASQPSYQQTLKLKRADGSVDSLHMRSDSPIALSTSLLDPTHTLEPEGLPAP
ncbi:MAG: winged helix-turn-helix domain-containing protein [Bacteroidetes bacterium]|nr:winged helix-turn-helix domain-containing protein [Bacteroidota bacterium]